MSSFLTNNDWDQLLERIKEGRCTPFLGAGINYGLLPLGADVAQSWAKKYEYPLKDSFDLARVSQFLALKGPDKLLPKELFRRMFKQRIKDLFKSEKRPNFVAPYHPLGVLAALPLPVYITTNYDDFMFRALRANNKNAYVELCSWNSLLQEYAAAIYPDLGSTLSNTENVQVTEFAESRFLSPSSFTPTAFNPVVFHMHGHYEQVDSMVLTENDYLDFLVNMSKDQKLLPTRIKDALTRSSLLFIGYSLADPNFRVLFRGLIHPLAENRRLSIAIQLLPSDVAQPNEQAAQEYLTKYFEDIKIKVYWGKAEQFAAELWDRWILYK